MLEITGEYFAENIMTVAIFLQKCVYKIIVSNVNKVSCLPIGNNGLCICNHRDLNVRIDTFPERIGPLVYIFISPFTFIIAYGIQTSKLQYYAILLRVNLF